MSKGALMKRKYTNIISILLLIIFGTLLTVGIIKGEALFILRHGIRVCLECIGIG